MAKFKEFNQLGKESRFKLLGLSSRGVFLLARSEIREATKSLAVLSATVFAGSIAFLGIRGEYGSSGMLALSWLCLLLAVLSHLFVHVGLVSAMVEHAHTEARNEDAMDVFRAEGVSEKSLLAALSSHYPAGKFFTSARLIMFFFILQSFTTLVGCIAMGLFAFDNI